MNVKLGNRCRSRFRPTPGLIVLATALAFLSSAQIARAAATFNVNSTADAPDATNNNGICETAPGNKICTVRAAFEEANTFAGADTINVPAGHYVLTLGQLPLSQNAAINGAGAAVSIISGVDTNRVVAIPPAGGVTATIAGVTINHGFDSDFGGGIRNGSGDILTVADSIITTNSSANAGGGIKNDGTLTVERSTISSNKVTALGSVGGGIFTGGPVTIVDSTISSNEANGGFSAGGGIFSNGDMTITNSTISSNKTPGGTTYGGGVFTNNPVTFANATIASNAAGSEGGGVFSNALITYKNTIVASNSGPAYPNCKNNGGATADHSLESANTCGFTTAGNQNGKDPLLGPLADNGGPTQTHALLAGSPAIDKGTNSGCPTTDQRGVIRAGNACDIGAYERTPPGVTTGGASGFNTAGATVSGFVLPNLLPTTYHFDYGLTSTYGSASSVQSAGAGNAAATVNASLTGLKSNTTYHYRLVGSSADGTSIGLDATFKTVTFTGASLSGRTLRVSHRKASLRVSCPGETAGGNCQIAGGLYATSGKLPASLSKRRRKARRLGFGKFSVTAGKKQTKRISLNRAGRKRLKGRRRKARARLVLTSRDNAGNTKTKTYKVKLKRTLGVRAR